MTFCADAVCRDFTHLLPIELHDWVSSYCNAHSFRLYLYSMNVVCRGQVSVRTATALGRRLGASRPLTGLGFFACRPSRTPIVPHSLGTRSFQQLANQPPKPTALPKVAEVAKKQDLGDDSVHISQAEQRRKDWNIIKRLAKHIWPKDDWSTRGRVIAGIALLVSAKVLPIQRFYCCDCYIFQLAIECPSTNPIQVDHRLFECGTYSELDSMDSCWLADSGL